jgi:hypothetical protein
MIDSLQGQYQAGRIEASAIQGSQTPYSGERLLVWRDFPQSRRCCERGSQSKLATEGDCHVEIDAAACAVVSVLADITCSKG